MWYPVRPRVSRRPYESKWHIFMRYMKMASYLPLALLAFACLLGLLRFFVIFLETIELVRGERDADVELLDLCATGAARNSPKMQSACMQASAARASPMIVAAIMKSITVFLTECWGLVAQPMQAMTGLGLVTIMGLTPWLAPLKALLMARTSASTSDTDFRDDHVVVLTEGPFDENCSALTLRNRGMPARFLNAPAYLEEAGKQSDTRSAQFVDDSGFEEISLQTTGSLRQEPALWSYGSRPKTD